MLKIGITNQSDQDEALKLLKREQYEEERKKRIFNAKQRLFGLDLVTLEQQIAEKKRKQIEEEACKKRYEAHEEHEKRIIRAKAKELEKERRIQEADLLYYRCKYQRKDQRREFDLNDPEYLKKAKPMRLADDDSTLGISSAQVFAGEDIYNMDRKKRQHQQQRDWLDKQMIERRKFEEEHSKAEKMWFDSISSREKLLEDVARDGYFMRNQIIDKTRQYNLEMAQHKQLERERKKRECREDDMAEIYNMLTSDMLNENGKKNGKNSIDTESLLKDREKQVKEVTQRQNDQGLIDRQWEQYAMNWDRELTKHERLLDRKRREQQNDVIRANHKLAEEQKIQKQEAKKLLVNTISDEFYDQFNKTSR